MSWWDDVAERATGSAWETLKKNASDKWEALKKDVDDLGSAKSIPSGLGSVGRIINNGLGASVGSAFGYLMDSGGVSDEVRSGINDIANVIDIGHLAEPVRLMIEGEDEITAPWDRNNKGFASKGFEKHLDGTGQDWQDFSSGLLNGIFALKGGLRSGFGINTAVKNVKGAARTMKGLAKADSKIIKSGVKDASTPGIIPVVSNVQYGLKAGKNALGIVTPWRAHGVGGYLKNYGALPLNTLAAVNPTAWSWHMSPLAILSGFTDKLKLLLKSEKSYGEDIWAPYVEEKTDQALNSILESLEKMDSNKNKEYEMIRQNQYSLLNKKASEFPIDSKDVEELIALKKLNPLEYERRRKAAEQWAIDNGFLLPEQK